MNTDYYSRLDVTDAAHVDSVVADMFSGTRADVPRIREAIARVIFERALYGARESVTPR